jgi:hypothetical protein
VEQVIPEGVIQRVEGLVTSRAQIILHEARLITGIVWEQDLLPVWVLGKMSRTFLAALELLNPLMRDQTHSMVESMMVLECVGQSM